MPKLRNMLFAVGAAALFLAPAAPAVAAPSEQDTTFLRAAHQANLAEIATGTIAQQKGQSQQVKDLGARFVADHTALDQALQGVATALGVSLPNAPNAEQRAIAARYQATNGQAFDALFISTQMETHMKSMRLGQTELARGSDPQAKKVAQDSAPVIKSHHDSVTAAARALGLPTDIDTGSGGEAAPRSLGTAGMLLIGVGLMVVAGAAFRIRRPRSVQR